MNQKYIIVKHKDIELPVIFSALLNHNEVASFSYSKDEIISAGFCQLYKNKYSCFGESTLLNLKSREDTDSKILNRYLLNIL